MQHRNLLFHHTEKHLFFLIMKDQEVHSGEHIEINCKEMSISSYMCVSEKRMLVCK